VAETGTVIEVVTPPEDRVWFKGYYAAGIWSVVVMLASAAVIGFFSMRLGFSNLALTVTGGALGGAAYTLYELILRISEDVETKSRRYYFLVYFLGPFLAVGVSFIIYFFFFSGGEFNAGGLTISANTRGSYVALGIAVGFLWQTLLTTSIPALSRQRIGLPSPQGAAGGGAAGGGAAGGGAAGAA
jgi:hypothetical protein